MKDKALLPRPFRSTVGSAVPSAPQGNLFDFLRLTEWRGPRVLYFGDHLYSDLAVRGGAGFLHREGKEPSHLALRSDPRPILSTRISCCGMAGAQEPSSLSWSVRSASSTRSSTCTH